MATRDTLVTVSDGDQLNDGYFNDIKNLATTMVLYADTGFDVSQSGAGTNSDDHELTTISAADLTGATYLVISVMANASMVRAGSSGESQTANIQFQTKEIGGAYADTMTKRSFATRSQANNEADFNVSTRHVLTWYHTLTANEKADGVAVKILAEAVVVSGGTCSLTNNQTILTLK